MRIRYGDSPWIHQYPSSRRPGYPRYRGDRAADVVIVGAGLTGCATAYVCAMAGLRPVVLEQDLVGQGSAGRSAGLMLADPGPSFQDIAALHGKRVARHVFQTWRRSALEGAALLRRVGVRCGLAACDEWLVPGPEGEKFLRRERDARVDAGLEAVQFGPVQIAKTARLAAPLALKVRDCFSLDPYRASLGLAMAAVKRGGEIHERSHVRKIRFSRKDVEVVTDSGSIRSRVAIVTTGTATEEFAPLVRHFRGRERYLVLTEPLTPALRKQLPDPGLAIRTTGEPSWGVRWTSDHRLLLSGGDQAATPTKRREAVLTQRTGQLMYELLTKCPSISGLRPEYGWEASYGDTTDGLMRIGPHRNYPHHLFALGGEPDSVTGAFLAARVLLRAVGGAPERGDDVFGFLR